MLPREELLKGVENRDTIARVIDLAEQAIKTWEVVFSDFLSPPEVAQIQQPFQRLTEVQLLAWGGYPQAERQRLAIAQLQQIRSDDLTGYAEAQKLLAQYNSNLGQVKIRRQAEQASVETLQRAQDRIEKLLASIPTDATSVNQNYIISELQGIINELEKVQNGTTAYLKAQELLLSAQNKLKQLQPNILPQGVSRPHP